MKVYQDFTLSRGDCGFQTAVTLGTFDGVHVGHRRILEKVVSRSKQHGLDATAVTFDRPPSAVLKGVDNPGLLSTIDEKLDIFENMGIDRTFIIRFTEETASITAEDFIRNYLSDCFGMRYFIVGYDHRFGRDRGISPEELRMYGEKLGFDVEIMGPVSLNGFVVKSSTIRSLVRGGDVRNVSALLGNDYSIQGTVLHGAGDGKSIGIPTANLLPENADKIIPANGVYAGWAECEGVVRPGVISVGPRPTFNKPGESIEIHIPGYSGDLYGKRMRIGFISRLRGIVKFDSSDALVRQIQKDIEDSRRFNALSLRLKKE